jgi:hypothetical protein
MGGPMSAPATRGCSTAAPQTGQTSGPGTGSNFPHFGHEVSFMAPLDQGGPLGPPDDATAPWLLVSFGHRPSTAPSRRPSMGHRPTMPCLVSVRRGDHRGLAMEGPSLGTPTSKG